MLSREGEDTVKVRDELLDVKHLESVERRRARAVAAGHEGSLSAHGWLRPAQCSQPFALKPRRPSARPTRSTRSCAPADRPASPSPCTRSGTHYTIGGCMAELTEVRDRRAESHATIAVESEDADSGDRPPCAELGLGSLPNVSYPRGLKALLGIGARSFAVIDVGTNSVKFHIGERSADGVVADGCRPRRGHAPRAKASRRQRRLNNEPMERTVDGDCSNGRRGPPERSGRDRRGGHGGAEDRVQQPGVSRSGGEPQRRPASR